jgi:hypothetical protein
MTTEPTSDSQHTNYYLAQINVALMKAPLHDPIMAEFANALDKVNAIAEKSPGFVWRLQTPFGDATNICQTLSTTDSATRWGKGKGFLA